MLNKDTTSHMNTHVAHKYTKMQVIHAILQMCD